MTPDIQKGITLTLEIIQSLSKGTSPEALAELHNLPLKTIEEIKTTVNLAATWMQLGRQ